MTDSTPIPDADLAELERLREAATPGPWFVPKEWPNEIYPETAGEMGDDPDEAVAVEMLDSDAKFVVAAVNALPALIRTVREQAKRIQELESQLTREVLARPLCPTCYKEGADLTARSADERDAEITRLRAELKHYQSATPYYYDSHYQETTSKALAAFEITDYYDKGEAVEVQETLEFPNNVFYVEDADGKVHRFETKDEAESFGETVRAALDGKERA